MASRSCARVKTRPGCRASVASSWNSVPVRSMASPAARQTALSARRRSGPIAVNTSPREAETSLRRSTAFTRATSSRGLNGFVT